MSHWSQKARQYWQQRSWREQGLLLCMAIILVVVLYSGVWQPARTFVIHHQATSSAQQQNALYVQRLAKEAKQLQTQPIVPVFSASALRETIPVVFKKYGLSVRDWMIDTDGSKVVTLQGSADFDSFLKGLAELVQHYHVVVISLSVQKMGLPGQVQISASLSG